MIQSGNAILEVFGFWQTALSNSRSRLDDRRRKAIQARLRDGYTVEDLQLAILGCKASDWHNGSNDRGRRYVSIELICRDADHVDQFIEIAERTAHHELAKIASRPHTPSGARSEATGKRTEETQRAIEALRKKFGIDREATA